MPRWFRRKRRSPRRTCTECGKATVRESRLCVECEREEERRSIDAQRGFSVDLAGYVRVPQVPSMPFAAEDAAGTPLHE